MSFAAPAWDMTAYVWINQEASNWLLDAVMPILSQQIWLWLALVAAVTALLARAGWRRLLPILCILLAVGIADLSANIIKKSVGQVRPLNAVAETRRLDHGEWVQLPADFVQTKQRGTSFPSAHAANSMAIAVLLMALYPRLRPWMLVLPLLVGYSRIYLGKHYPSDVMTGWLLGLIIAMILLPLLARLKAYSLGQRPLFGNPDVVPSSLQDP